MAKCNISETELKRLGWVFFILLLVLVFPFLVQAQVNINTADQAELETLTGIGPTLAERIIEYRQSQGTFERIEDLTEVSGIGEVTFSDLANDITVGSVESETDQIEIDSEPSDLININTASRQTLKSLPGVGEVTAENILNYRQSVGQFSSLADLTEVSGIGPATFSDLEPLITVGQVEVDDQSDVDDGSDSVTSVSADPTDQPSAHTSPVEIQAGDLPPAVTLSIGRDRLAGVGTELPFTVYSEQDLSEFEFEWSMGDGTVRTGAETTHRYRHPGRYVVILTARDADGGEAVGRLEVEVIEPELDLTAVDEAGITITNYSTGEVNLLGWQLESGDRQFKLEGQTIILPEQSVMLAESITGVVPTEEVVLRSPLGSVQSRLSVSDQSGESVSTESVEATQKQLSDIKERLSRLQHRLEAQEQPEPAVEELAQTGPVEALESPAIDVDEPVEINSEPSASDNDHSDRADNTIDIDQTTEADDLDRSGQPEPDIVYQVEPDPAWWQNLFSIPGRMYESIRATIFRYD